MYAIELNVTSGGRRTPAGDLISAGIATPFYGNLDLVLPPPAYDINARVWVDSVDGAFPFAAVDPAYDDSAWRVVPLPLYQSDYLGPPTSYTPLSGTMVPHIGGGGPGRWLARWVVDFPPSARRLTASGATWSGGSWLASPGECLYLMEFWTDNDGVINFYDPVTFAGGAGVSNGGIAGDYQGAYILSMPPGNLLYIVNKEGDNSFDGLGVRLSTLTGTVNNGWQVGSIAMS